MANLSKDSFGKRNKIFYGFLLIVNDLIFLALSCFLSYYLRFYTTLFGKGKPTYSISDSYIFYFIIFILVVIVISFLFRLYSWNNIYKKPAYYLKILIPPVLSIIVIIIFGRLYESFSFSRILLVTLFFFSLVLLFLSRALLGIVTKKIFKKSGILTDDLNFEIGENLIALRDVSRIKKKVIYGIFLIVNDIVLLVAAFYLSYYIRFNTGVLSERALVYHVEVNYIFYSIVFILSAIFILFLFRLYNWDYIYKGSGYYSRIFKSVIINIIVIIMAGYLIDLFTFSRKWILLLFLISSLLLFLSRFIIEMMTKKVLKKLNMLSKTIIIGIGENAKRIEDSLKKNPYEGYRVVGCVDNKKRIFKNRKYSKDFTVLGFLDNLREIISKNGIQSIIVSSTEYKYYEMLDILEKLKGLDVSVLVFPGFFEFSVKRTNMREVAGVPLMQVANVGFFGINLFLKNLIDYLLGSILFLFFIPIYLIVGVMIKLDSKGPVFYEQKRYTKDCKVFYMHKFRTMYIDAGERLKELTKFNEADGPLFKMKNDPRITKVGRMLRRFSIDELPQIINVLKGELSLVGPRPPLPKEVEEYEEWQLKRLNVKQGITGLWQVSGRSKLSFEEMARLDLYYIQNWSIGMDVNIILKTIPAVLFSRGAY